MTLVALRTQRVYRVERRRRRRRGPVERLQLLWRWYRPRRLLESGHA